MWCLARRLSRPSLRREVGFTRKGVTQTVGRAAVFVDLNQKRIAGYHRCFLVARLRCASFKNLSVVFHARLFASNNRVKPPSIFFPSIFFTSIFFTWSEKPSGSGSVSGHIGTPSGQALAVGERLPVDRQRSCSWRSHPGRDHTVSSCLRLFGLQSQSVHSLPIAPDASFGTRCHTVTRYKS